jgi:maleamate amidohydrolase
MPVDFNAEMERTIEFRKSKPLRGAGTNPAVVVVDFQRAFVEGPAFGEPTTNALNATAELLAAARDAKVQVIYLTVIYDYLTDIPLSWRPEYIGETTTKLMRGGEMTEIHPIVASQVGDIVIEKYHASGFYNTDLDEKLRHLGIDTLILAGTSTSGCVRATAVDAAARSYRFQVVEECVDDFRAISSESALHDLAERYGDVISLKDAIGYFESPAIAGRA